jgi:hypothetical protein
LQDQEKVLKILKEVFEMAKITQPWEKLVMYVEKHPKRGDVLLHSDIERITGVVYGTTRYGYAVSKAKKELTKKQLRFKSVSGVGYRIMEHHEYDDDAASQVLQAANHLSNAKFISDCTDVSKLNKKQTSNHNKLANEIGQANIMLQSSVTLANSIRVLNKGVKP